MLDPDALSPNQDYSQSPTIAVARRRIFASVTARIAAMPADMVQEWKIT
jgi:hypothetical protein